MTSILSWITSSITSKPPPAVTVQKEIATNQITATTSTIVTATAESNLKNQTQNNASNQIQKVISVAADEEDWVLFEDLDEKLKTKLRLTHPSTTVVLDTDATHENIQTSPPQNIDSGKESSVSTIGHGGHFEQHVSESRSSSDSNLKSASPLKDSSAAGISTSFSSLLAAAQGQLKRERNDKESLKSQPRTLASLAQIKDQELKMKKMKKLGHRDRFHK